MFNCSCFQIVCFTFNFTRERAFKMKTNQCVDLTLGLRVWLGLLECIRPRIPLLILLLIWL